MENEDYQKFIEGKIPVPVYGGFDLDVSEVNPLLKDHQKAAVLWAVKGGCRALFEAFGLGKTFQQLEVIRLVLKHGGGRGLIIAPLGVRQEFKRDAEKLGIEINFIRRIEECTDEGIYITNYETVRDGKLDPNLFTAVTLDEASCLRSYGSQTYQTFLTLFKKVKYKFVATATPSPNRYKELIHYAGFLGIMDTGQALTRWFQRDSTQANNLTLYPHKEVEFWLWISSWALFLQRPSDLGFDDTGYDLPKLHIHYHEVQTDLRVFKDDDGQMSMFADSALSLKDASREKRESMPQRVAKAAEIIANEPDKHFILWHDQEAERHAINKAIPECKDVYGSQDLDVREKRIIDFSDGKYKYLSTKPVIAGSGCNFQRHCADAIFVGIGFKFNDFIQAVHRIVRFMQTKECHIHLIYADTEREILKVLETKWAQHNSMVGKMTEIIHKHGLNHSEMADVLKRGLGTNRLEVKGENFIVANNDCVKETRSMDENSVDLIVTSIPFSNHYEYTPHYCDFGHTDNNDHFWKQMDFLSVELLRILKPGRMACIHVKDRILFGNVTGAGVPTVSPFHAETIFHYQKHGFDYMGMITIVTDVVRENNQTYRLGWSEQCKDGTKMGVGSPEYVILVRKPQTDRSRGYADEPVTKEKSDYTRAQWQVDAHAFWRSSGNRQLTAEEMSQLPHDVLSKVFTKYSLEEIYDYDHHVKIGEELDKLGSLPSTFMSLAPGSHHPEVWHDVLRMKTLNGEQAKRNVQLHVCPFQIDVVERLITRYSNKGDLVFDPFGGLMTVPYCAVKMDRKGRASELNTGYFMDGVKYLEQAERQKGMPTLFDFMDEEVA